MATRTKYIGYSNGFISWSGSSIYYKWTRRCIYIKRSKMNCFGC